MAEYRRIGKKAEEMLATVDKKGKTGAVSVVVLSGERGRTDESYEYDRSALSAICSSETCCCR